MNELRRDAILIALADGLLRERSWCGETHLQKATYVLQDALHVPMGFDFILYKYGPFSFDLRDALTAMRADGLLALHAQWPYGPSLVPTEEGIELMGAFANTVGKHRRKIDLVCRNLGPMNVADLERFATAVFVTLEGRVRTAAARAERLAMLKPHVTEDEAAAAVAAADELVRSWRA